MSSSPLTSEQFRSKFTAIDKEVTVLNFKWTYFLQLFGTEERVNVLNAAAAAIFKVIEDAMFFDIVLSVMRLVDPERVGAYRNLSFESLLQEIPDTELQKKISDMQAEIRLKANSMRIWRDKKLAHNDLSAHSDQASVLPVIQYKDLFDALRLIRQLMGLLHQHYFDTDCRYLCITEADGEKLLFYLQYGLDCWSDDKAASDLKRWKVVKQKLGTVQVR